MGRKKVMNAYKVMNTYDYATWEDYVKGKAEEMKLKNPDLGPEFLPGACLEKWIWDQTKKHHDMVFKALEEKSER